MKRLKVRKAPCSVALRSPGLLTDARDQDAPDEFEASISADIAQYEDYSVSGSVLGAPINDQMGWLANGYWFDDGGQYNNAVSVDGNGNRTKDPLGGGSGFGRSLTFNWTPTDTLDVKARIEYVDEEYDDPPRARYVNDVTVTAPNPGATDLDDPFVATYPRTFGDATLLDFPAAAW